MAACLCQPESPATREAGPARGSRLVPITLGLAVLAGGGYAAYQRVGTTANVDTITFVRDYGGGFVAVGMTDRQPGSIALSALDRADLRVEADGVEQGIAGRHTQVRVVTPAEEWTARLRGPRVVFVDDTGHVSSVPVRWSHADFVRILEGLDRGHEGGSAPRACGRAFADFREAVRPWPEDRVPGAVRRRFLEGQGRQAEQGARPDDN